MTNVKNAIETFGSQRFQVTQRPSSITKLFDSRYICDKSALQELISGISEKLEHINGVETVEFSLLISFNDKTHRDGLFDDLFRDSRIAIGKKTDKVVLSWKAYLKIEESRRELTITARISNPINPLLFIQAAFSQTTNEIDSLELETCATSATVTGAQPGLSDEIFLIFSKWIDARNKPHSSVSIGEFYSKHVGIFYFLNSELLPLLIVAITSSFIYENHPERSVQLLPLVACLFLILQSTARKLNRKMTVWSGNSKHLNLFLLTNGDNDAQSKTAAKAQNSVYKLVVTIVFQVLIKIFAVYICSKYFATT